MKSRKLRLLKKYPVDVQEVLGGIMVELLEIFPRLQFVDIKDRGVKEVGFTAKWRRCSECSVYLQQRENGSVTVSYGYKANQWSGGCSNDVNISEPDRFENWMQRLKNEITSLMEYKYG